MNNRPGFRSFFISSKMVYNNPSYRRGLYERETHPSAAA